jgi:hypothetical protein
MKAVFEQVMFAEEVDVEDNGCARIFEVGDLTADSETEASNQNDGLFVRIQSWSDNAIHTDFDKFVDKRIRVTIETIDD